MFKRLKQSISVMRHKQARLFLLLTIILFNVALWLVTSVLAYIIKPGYYGDILNALLTSGLVWILDPGNYEAEHAELALRILSLVTIIISMITFSGGIIAYVSSWLSSFINRSEGGTRKLYVFNHILILNWNIKALELIADYADDEDAVNIVVVSEHDRQEIEELIATRLYEHGAHKINKKVKIIVVKGNPFSKKTIEKVCLEKARSVIILSDESNLTLGNGHHNDITAMKTLMLVTKLSDSPDQTVIVEVTCDQTRQLITNEICSTPEMKSRVIPLLSDELLGKMIAQILVSPSLSQVYSALMLSEGTEVFPTHDSEVKNFILTHDACVPIYRDSGRLYAIAPHEDDLLKLRHKPLENIPHLKIDRKVERKDFTLVVFGKNNKLKFILDSIHEFEKDCKMTVTIKLIESDTIDVVRKTIEEIPYIDTILLLSDDHLKKEEVDSKVLVTLLLIQDIEKLKDTNIVVELLDPRHLDIAQSYRIQHTIVSNRYVSHMMSHIGKERDLFNVYNDLMTFDDSTDQKNGLEFYTYKAHLLFDEPFPMTFSTIGMFVAAVAESSNASILAFGCIQNGKVEFFGEHLDKPEPFVLSPDDIVIVVAH